MTSKFIHLIYNYIVTGLVSELSSSQKTGNIISWTSLLELPCGSAGKESACNAGDLGSIPRLGRSPGEGKGDTLQYSGLENSVDCVGHRVAKSQIRPSDFHFTSLCSWKEWAEGS